ncbi:hypothetical protein HDU96_003685 [Phlyctochytrium bullatum]|nr:hypothetical protein HDU96_003685 [Phlyctochytrium bullatum]
MGSTSSKDVVLAINEIRKAIPSHFTDAKRFHEIEAERVAAQLKRKKMFRTEEQQKFQTWLEGDSAASYRDKLIENEHDINVFLGSHVADGTASAVEASASRKRSLETCHDLATAPKRVKYSDAATQTDTLWESKMDAGTSTNDKEGEAEDEAANQSGSKRLEVDDALEIISDHIGDVGVNEDSKANSDAEKYVGDEWTENQRLEVDAMEITSDHIGDVGISEPSKDDVALDGTENQGFSKKPTSRPATRARDEATSFPEKHVDDGVPVAGADNQDISKKPTSPPTTPTRDEANSFLEKDVRDDVASDGTENQDFSKNSISRPTTRTKDEANSFPEKDVDDGVAVAGTVKPTSLPAMPTGDEKSSLPEKYVNDGVPVAGTEIQDSLKNPTSRPPTPTRDEEKSFPEMYVDDGVPEAGTENRDFSKKSRSRPTTPTGDEANSLPDICVDDGAPVAGTENRDSSKEPTSPPATPKSQKSLWSAFKALTRFFGVS